ncbi:hypothetical protein TNCV_2104001 [Trichonephila clavipes]|nr:hypothetical protein TNCV_2104001 [Trichonephila clavipes]
MFCSRHLFDVRISFENTEKRLYDPGNFTTALMFASPPTRRVVGEFPTIDSNLHCQEKRFSVQDVPYSQYKYATHK